MLDRISKHLFTVESDLVAIPRVASWAHQLAASMQAVELPLASRNDLRIGAAVAQQSSLLLHLAGDSDGSMAACHKFTDLFLALFQKTKDASYLAAGVQTWIQGAHLDRLQGRSRRCLSKMQGLDVARSDEFKLRGEAFAVDLLPSDQRELIMSHVVAEHCKVWLEHRQYQMVEEAVQDQIWQKQAVLVEALVISQVARGSEKALDTCLTMMQGACRGFIKQVFYLRLCELAAYSGELADASAHLMGMLTDCPPSDLASLRLLRYAYACLKRWSADEESLAPLRVSIIDAYERLGDELGLASFLIDLITLHGPRSLEVPAAHLPSPLAYLCELADQSGYADLAHQVQSRLAHRVELAQGIAVSNNQTSVIDEFTTKLDQFCARLSTFA